MAQLQPCQLPDRLPIAQLGASERQGPGVQVELLAGALPLPAIGAELQPLLILPERRLPLQEQASGLQLARLLQQRQAAAIGQQSSLTAAVAREQQGIDLQIELQWPHLRQSLAESGLGGEAQGAQQLRWIHQIEV